MSDQDDGEGPYVRTYTTHAISVGGDYIWHVKEADTVKAGGKTFIRLQPHITGLVKLVVEGVIDYKDLPTHGGAGKTITASLGGTPGMRALKELRNEAQRAELQPTQPTLGLFDVPTSGSSSLSDPKDGSKQRLLSFKKKKGGSEKAKETLSVTIPAFESMLGSLPEKSIEMLPPKGREENLAIHLEAKTIQHCVLFMRYHGIELGTLSQKRSWHRLSAEEKGTPKWRRYSRGRREDGAEDEGEEGDEEAGEAGEAGADGSADWWQ